MESYAPQKPSLRVIIHRGAAGLALASRSCVTVGMERVEDLAKARSRRLKYVRWIDDRAFRGLVALMPGDDRSDLLVASWHDGNVLRSVPTGEPKGIFRAVSTRDGEAQERSGMPFYEINAKGTDVRGQALFEIKFGDGVWMLASASDLQTPSA